MVPLQIPNWSWCDSKQSSTRYREPRPSSERARDVKDRLCQTLAGLPPHSVEPEECCGDRPWQRAVQERLAQAVPPGEGGPGQVLLPHL